MHKQVHGTAVAGLASDATIQVPSLITGRAIDHLNDHAQLHHNRCERMHASCSILRPAALAPIASADSVKQNSMAATKDIMANASLAIIGKWSGDHVGSSIPKAVVGMENAASSNTSSLTKWMRAFGMALTS